MGAWFRNRLALLTTQRTGDDEPAETQGVAVEERRFSAASDLFHVAEEKKLALQKIKEASDVAIRCFRLRTLPQVLRQIQATAAA